jgi:class 3 adenylate cyclase
VNEKNVERRLAVVLVTDVVDFSRMMGADEEATLLGLQKHRFAIIDPTIGQFRGRIVKSLGDGLLVMFESASEAVECALKIQRAVVQRNADVPETKRIRYRMGINMGEILVEDGDIFGDGVNIAARLQEVADPDGVAVTSGIHETVTRRIDWSFKDMGAHLFKNIAQPVRVYHYSSDPDTAPSHTAFRPFVDMPQKTSIAASGGCLCGNIRYEATQPPLGSMLCHCSICRRFSGAPVLGGTTFLSDAVTFTKAQPKYYKSSSIAERGFCPECGTSITYRGTVAQWTKWIMVFTATLDDPENHPPTYHLGIETAMPWLNIVDELPRTACRDSPSLVEAYRTVGEEVP